MKKKFKSNNFKKLLLKASKQNNAFKKYLLYFVFLFFVGSSVLFSFPNRTTAIDISCIASLYFTNPRSENDSNQTRQYFSGTVSVDWDHTTWTTCDGNEWVYVYYSNPNSRFIGPSIYDTAVLWDTTQVPDGDEYKMKVADSSNLWLLSDSQEFTVDNTFPDVFNITSPTLSLASSTMGTISLTFDATDLNPLIATSVTVAGFAANYVDKVGDTYTYSYAITGNEAEGPVTIISSATDAASNKTDTATTSLLTFDFSPPSITSIVSSPNPASSTVGTLNITFDATDTYTSVATTSMTVDGNDATFVSSSSDTYTYSYDVSSNYPSETNGNVDIVVSATDIIGNATSTSAVHVFDYIAPEATITYDLNRRVRDADTLVITATSSEAIVGTPTIAIDTFGTDLTATSMASTDGITWTYSYDVPSGSDGIATTTIFLTMFINSPIV